MRKEGTGGAGTVAMSSIPSPGKRFLALGDLLLGIAAVVWLLATAAYCARDASLFCGFLVALTVRAITPLWLAVPAWALVVAVRRAQSHAHMAVLAALIPAVAISVPSFWPFLGST